MIKAIDTFYNGNYYRSRLEARWAVMFDLLGIKYQYEPIGYVLSNGVCYLPDFYLPDFNVYAEVKPKLDADIFKHPDVKKWVDFVENGQHDLLLLHGNPHPYSMTLMTAPPPHISSSGLVTYDVGFHLETKLKNETTDKRVPFWRFWRGSGDECYEYLLPFVEAANKKRFEHS